MNEQSNSSSDGIEDPNNNTDHHQANHHSADNHISLFDFLFVFTIAIIFVLLSVSVMSQIAAQSFTLPLWVDELSSSAWAYFLSVSSLILFGYLTKKKLCFLHCSLFVLIVCIFLILILFFKWLIPNNSNSEMAADTLNDEKIVNTLPYSSAGLTPGNTYIPIIRSAECKPFEGEFIALCETLLDIKFEDIERYFGQLFLIGFEGKDKRDFNSSIAKEAINNLNIGGFILYKENSKSTNRNESVTREEQFDDFVSLVSAIQKESLRVNSGLPAFLATDAEGGSYSDLSRYGLLTPVPSSMALAATNNIASTRSAATILSTELSLLGLNMNFAPVLDINIAGDDTVILDRSYSESPDVVAKHGKEFILAHNRNNVISVAKHFPGHGGTVSGFHSAGLPESSFKLSDLKTAIHPFRELAVNEDGVKAVMTSHFLVNGISNENIAFEKNVVEGLLQKSKNIKFNSGEMEGIGFDGLVISDDLATPSVMFNRGECDKSKERIIDKLTDITIKSFRAGHDLLMFSHVVNLHGGDTNKLWRTRPRNDGDSSDDYRECWREAITFDEFEKVYHRTFKLLFEELEDTEKQVNKDRLVKSLLKILKAKQFVSALKPVDYETFVKVKTRNLSCASTLFENSLTYIGPTSSSSRLISSADNRDSVLYISPSRFEYGSLKQLRKGDGWEERKKKNINAFDFSEKFSSVFEKSVREINFWLDSKDTSNEIAEDSSGDLAELVISKRPDFIVYHVNKKAKWVVFQYFLKQLNKKNFKDFDRIYVVITHSPTMLGKRIDYRASTGPIDDLIRSVHMLVAYSGFGNDSGYPFRPGLVSKGLRDGSIFDNNKNTSLPISVPGIQTFKSPITNDQEICSKMEI